ncbi:MAG: DUF6172 family protein [Luteolibacter sp.]
MKKTFPLQVEGLKPPRVVEAIKHDVRKYVKRERRKALPEGVDFWDFHCRVGAEAANTKAIHVDDIPHEIDEAAKAAQTGIYIEILAAPGTRSKKPQGEG